MMDYYALKEEITRLGNYVAVQDHVACTDIDLSTLGGKIDALQDLIPTKIASIEEADRKQGLFSDRSTKPCPQQIPSYAGTLGLVRY